MRTKKNCGILSKAGKEYKAEKIPNIYFQKVTYNYRIIYFEAKSILCQKIGIFDKKVKKYC